MPLREVAQRLNLFSRMAACFNDRRNQEQVTHLLPDQLAQRVLGVALGYADVNDHDKLRHDPLLKVTATAKPGASSGAPLPALARSSPPSPSDTVPGLVYPSSIRSFAYGAAAYA